MLYKTGKEVIGERGRFASVKSSKKLLARETHIGYYLLGHACLTDMDKAVCECDYAPTEKCMGALTTACRCCSAVIGDGALYVR